MNHEQRALVALLRTRPGRLPWPRITEEVLEYGSAVTVWEQYHPELLIPSPTAAAALEEAEADLRTWERDGLHFMSVLDKEFPQRLLDIVETPPFLFAQGTIRVDDLGMSVVGSRKASARGLEMASSIARFLVREGLTVISGLAAGIDTAAHTAALGEGGRTVAFLGTGCGVAYPEKNRDLQAAIADHGLVLSQFWPDAPPQRHSFPMRNALMSGYGLATIVVEAGETSGARIQARLAVQHGRPVILSDIVVACNEWARQLMQRPGVHMVASLRELEPLVDEIRSEPQRTAEALRQLALQ